MKFLEKRRRYRIARDILKQSKFLCNMREDLLDDPTRQSLAEAQATLRDSMLRRDIGDIEKAGDVLCTQLSRLAPRQSFSTFRENLEILVVAVVVALGFRAYFIQPFKIPTGSMQPTLSGITSTAKAEQGFSDRLPMRLGKWFFTGEWYTKIRAKNAGQLIMTPDMMRSTPSYCVIGTRKHKVPKKAHLLVENGAYVSKGDLLWTGIVTAGDHVFVDKLSWNFSKPKRGDIMVFSTTDIESLPPGTFYIKRLIGLPGEKIAIHEPNIVVNGRTVTESEGILRVARSGTGYQNAGRLATPTDHIDLGPDEYFTLGDNTGNSRDGRYWGTVPQKNIVGPAFCVYWPIARWPIFRWFKKE